MDQPRVTLAQERSLKEGTFELRLEQGTGASHGKMWGKTIPGRRTEAPNKSMSHEKTLHIQGAESNFLKFRIIPQSPTEAVVKAEERMINTS